MTTLNERAKMGADLRERFGGGQAGDRSVTGSWDMAPDMHRITDEALFGSIWQRPGLKIEHREMIVLSALTVLQRENQLRRHVSIAVHLGLTPQQVIEVMRDAASQQAEAFEFLQAQSPFFQPALLFFHPMPFGDVPDEENGAGTPLDVAGDDLER